MKEREPVACRDRAASASELSDERERNDALSAPRATGDDHHVLAVGLACSVDLVHDQVVRQALLGEEHKALATLNLFRGDGQELT